MRFDTELESLDSASRQRLPTEGNTILLITDTGDCGGKSREQLLLVRIVRVRARHLPDWDQNSLPQGHLT